MSVTGQSTGKRSPKRAAKKPKEQSFLRALPPPKEKQEQVTLANYCRSRNLLAHHSPNEGKRLPQHTIALQAAGMSIGFPDMVIFNPCRYVGGLWTGVAIELKRTKGGVTSKEQQQWIDTLRALNWLAFVAKGADAAIEVLQRCDFMPTPKPEVLGE